MADQKKASVIRRKTRAAREGADPRVMSPVRALRLALARAADTLHDLPLIVATVEQRRVEAGEVETMLGNEGLFLLLDGAGGARAALRLCPGLVSALVEVQTTGGVRPGQVRARAPTRTDAAMVAPLVDALLAGFDGGMCEAGGDRVPCGFHFGDRVEDARALSLLMIDPEFDFFRLTVDLGPGLRTARLDLLLPTEACPPARDAQPCVPGDARRDASDPETMAAAVLAAPVPLDAVLARIRVPLHEAMALEAGRRLDIPKANLGKVRLVGAGGLVAAEGRLGQRDGCRALRLTVRPAAAASAPDSVKPGVAGKAGAQETAQTGAEEVAETAAALAPLSD